MRPLRYASTLLLFALGAAASSAPAASQTAPRGFATPYGTDFDGRAGVAVSRAADGGGPGALDPSFGTDGIASFAAPEAGGLAVQPDGKILTAGRFIGQAAVFRFLPDGAPDPDFGSNGIALVDLGGSLDFFGALALQPDGKIVAAGSKFLTPNGDGDGAAIARFLPDGTLDADFGTGGLVLEPGTPQSDTPDAFWSVDLRPDGRIIAGGLRGVVFAGSEDNACYAAQYLADGTRDASFGTDGLVSADPAADIYCGGGTLLPDGRYVLSADITNFEWAAIRLLEDGTLDPAFGA
ncbi:MAG: hypothetical protein R3181_13145, partial [Rubricoccaceae bacterium]|nr:hypothetical protein [Rubricoccaceae bacterium]